MAAATIVAAIRFRVQELAIFFAATHHQKAG
jgi:hypothetical protein